MDDKPVRTKKRQRTVVRRTIGVISVCCLCILVSALISLLSLSTRRQSSPTAPLQQCALEFCNEQRSCTTDDPCASNEQCDLNSNRCVPTMLLTEPFCGDSILGQSCAIFNNETLRYGRCDVALTCIVGPTATQFPCDGCDIEVDEQECSVDFCSNVAECSVDDDCGAGGTCLPRLNRC